MTFPARPMARPKKLVHLQPVAPRGEDVLLRGHGNSGFELVKAKTHEPIQTNIPTLEAAIEVARAHGAAVIWQQSVDNRGRALGDPVRLVKLTD
jgi:hypothetical protein